jgi:hypothetical protein
VAAALSDEAWAKIRKAAGLTRDAEARAALATLLFEEYPAFAYDRARWATAYQRSERMLKYIAELAELYRQAWLPDLPVDQFQAILAGHASALKTDVRTEADLYWFKLLWRRPEHVWLGARAIRRANKGQKNQQREWLYHRLCGIWLDNFHANNLTVTIPPWGGPPEGPLIEFMLAAMRQIIPHSELPSTESLRRAIDRERKERANAAQLRLDLQQRIMAS